MKSTTGRLRLWFWRRLMDGRDDSLHLLELAGLVTVSLMRQTRSLLLDGLLSIAGIGVVGEEFRRFRPAFDIELVEELRQLDGIVTGFRHQVRAHEISLAFGGARELEQNAVGAEPDAQLRKLPHHPATAGYLSGKHRRQLDEVCFRGLIGAVTQDYV